MPMGGMIGRAVQDVGKAWDEANASTPQGVKITVDEHNILRAAGIIEAEARRLGSEIDSIAQDLQVRPMGGDPVSAEAARVLNEKFLEGKESYVGRCRERVRMLTKLADQLQEAAKTYRLTEEQIEHQFNAALEDASAAEERPSVPGGWRAE